MKTKGLLFIALFLGSLTFAQTDKIMKIYQNNGKVLYVPLNSIDSVVHDESGFSSVTFNGYNYQTVILGNGQEWFAENLRTAKYANGDDILNILNSAGWTTIGVWAWYNNDSTYENPYGKLYNWYAAHDSRNVCPSGWHVPTDEEWTLLTTYLGGASVAGTKLKSTSGWDYEGNGTNESGLNFLPSGYFDGAFANFGNHGYWWSSSEYSSGWAWYLSLYVVDGYINRNYVNEENGFAIRCLRD